MTAEAVMLARTCSARHGILQPCRFVVILKARAVGSSCRESVANKLNPLLL